MAAGLRTVNGASEKAAALRRACHNPPAGLAARPRTTTAQGELKQKMKPAHRHPAGAAP
jgi:hypothetical protein